MNKESIDIYGTRNTVLREESFQIKVGVSGRLRISRNLKEAAQYRKEGYIVEDGGHPSKAYFAAKGKSHNDPNKAHEITIGRIFAENGFSFSLDSEGNSHTRLPDGTRITLRSLDGKVERLTHEIYGLTGMNPNPKNRPLNVADAIDHSLKRTKGTSYYKQAEVAITFTPIGSPYTKEDIEQGFKIFKDNRKRYNAKPMIYLHVDEATRTIWFRRVKLK